MDLEKLPKATNEEYKPNLDAQDEEVTSGGNNRLMYILGGIIIALVLGYIALPKGGGSGLASVTPSFMLDDAAVQGTVPTSADSIAAGLKAAPVAAKSEDEAPKAALKTPATTRQPTTAPTTVPTTAPTAAAVPIAAAPAPTAPAPEPVSAPAPAAAPEQAAPPANVTMSGKIEDENGKPMIGATVMLKGSNKGTSTDANGNYSIEVPGGADNILLYGYAGYEDETVRSRGNSAMNVTLTPRAKAVRKRR